MTEDKNDVDEFRTARELRDDPAHDLDPRDGREELPWCPSCDAFAVPDDQNKCGECGTRVSYRRGN